MPASMLFAGLLRRHRLAAGLTQEELAERAGLSPRGMIYLERGDRLPFRDTVRRLADALDLTGAARAQFEAVTRRPSVQGAAGPESSTRNVPSGSAFAPVEAPHAASRVPANPFFHRGPVRDSTYFYGRAAETQYLIDLLCQGQCVAVCGPRRLGKTSLLYHVADPAIAAAHGLDPASTRWVYLDGGTLDGLGEEWLYGAVTRALGGEEDEVPYPRFVNCLRTLAGQGVRLILELDEFEVVAANPAFGPTLFHRLRGLIGRFPLQIVTASRDPLLDLTAAHPEILSSPFFNIFAPLRLALFPEDDARQLLLSLSARGGRQFGPATCEWLLELAGPHPHPLFLQVAGYRAFAQLHRGGAEGELAQATREGVLAAILADLEQHLRYSWRSLDAEARATLAALPLLDHDGGGAALGRLAAAGLLRGRAYLGGALERFVRMQEVETLLQAGPVLMDLGRGLVAAYGVQVHLTLTAEYRPVRLCHAVFRGRPTAPVTFVVPGRRSGVAAGARCTQQGELGSGAAISHAPRVRSAHGCRYLCGD